MEDNIQQNINNYKGVMLCSRPNEIVKFLKDKPFCSRVDPKAQIGLNPVKKEDIIVNPQFKKRINFVLQRHKEWLSNYKMKMKLVKENQEEQSKAEREKFEKIKQIASKDRERTKKMKQEFQQLNQNIVQELENNKVVQQKSKPLTEENLRKLEEQQQPQPQQQKEKQQQEVSNKEQELTNSKIIKQIEEMKFDQPQEQGQSETKKKKKKQVQIPQWALTENELKAQEDHECEDILNFVNNLDYEKYMQDVEVSSMMKAIKQRIEDLKNQDNWLEKQQQQKLKLKEKEKEVKLEEDNQSQTSCMIENDDNKSAASKHTQKSIQSLKSQLEEKKKGVQEWDKSSMGKQTAVDLEDRIAKLVADEVLRNYKNLGMVHSNQSIRKLLEQEAKSHLQQNKDIVEKYQGPNIAITKDRTLRKNEVDPNTLPYMHRNPAI